MIFLITFLALTLIEFLIIWNKWSDIKDYQEMGQGVASFTGADKKKVYTKTVTVIGNVLRNFRKLLIIPIGILLFLNLVASFVIWIVVDVVILNIISLFV